MNQEFDLSMAMASVEGIRKDLEPYMNDTDKNNFDWYTREPYTESNLRAVKDLIRIIEKESGKSFIRALWKN